MQHKRSCVKNSPNLLLASKIKSLSKYFVVSVEASLFPVTCLGVLLKNQ